MVPFNVFVTTRLLGIKGEHREPAGRSADARGLCCPRCQPEIVIKYGSYMNFQRYFCEVSFDVNRTVLDRSTVGRGRCVGLGSCRMAR